MTIDVEEVEGFLEHTHELGVLVEDVHVAKTVSENDTIQLHMQSLDLIKIQSSTRLINEYNHGLKRIMYLQTAVRKMKYTL